MAISQKQEFASEAGLIRVEGLRGVGLGYRVEALAPGIYGF